MSYTQYWKLIHWHDFSCGVEHTKEVSTKLGVSTSITSTVASELGVEIDGLSSKLSTSLSTTVTITEEKNDTHTIKMTAPKCSGVTLSSWQLVDKFEITVIYDSYGFVGTDEYTLEVPLDIYKDDPIVYPKPECCPEDKRLGMFFQDSRRQAYALSFPLGKVITLGIPEPDGCVQLAITSHKHSIGDLIPSSILNSEITSLIPIRPQGINQTYGILNLYSGSTKEFFLEGAALIRSRIPKVLNFLNTEGTSEIVDRGIVFEISEKTAKKIIAARKKSGGKFSSIEEIVGEIDQDELDKLIKILANRPCHKS